MNLCASSIVSERLFLRPFVPEDELAVVAFLTNPEFMVYSPSGALSEGDAKIRFYELSETYRKFGFAKFAVTLRKSNKLIGYCGIEPCEIAGSEQMELGFRLHPAYRGYGYATEAGSSFLAWYERHFPKPVIAFTEPSNHSSIRVLQKLDFQQSGTAVFIGMPVIVFKRALSV
ncbi:MAG: GNAT family N-acetyltransferase [Cellvibrionaceae bacterium]|nr:GNAT family N-acetyltransferase [Cellvibrionaceae bacterium]